MNAMSFFLAIFYVQKNRVMLKFEWEIIIRTKIEWSKYQKFFIKLRFCYESIAGRIWDTPNCNIVAQQLVLMALTSPHCPQKKKSKLRRKEHVPHKHGAMEIFITLSSWNSRHSSAPCFNLSFTSISLRNVTSVITLQILFNIFTIYYVDVHFKICL